KTQQDAPNEPTNTSHDASTSLGGPTKTSPTALWTASASPSLRTQDSSRCPPLAGRDVLQQVKSCHCQRRGRGQCTCRNRRCRSKSRLGASRRIVSARCF